MVDVAEEEREDEESAGAGGADDDGEGDDKCETPALRSFELEREDRSSVSQGDNAKAVKVAGAGACAGVSREIDRGVVDVVVRGNSGSAGFCAAE